MKGGVNGEMVDAARSSCPYSIGLRPANAHPANADPNSNAHPAGNSLTSSTRRSLNRMQGM